MGGKSKAAAKEAAVKLREKSSGEAHVTTLDAEGLLARPREYVVRLQFPEVPMLSPPIIQVKDSRFHYPGGPDLFETLDFGIDMDR
jgi:ATP-binding cassette, subfamily F, member 1